jgi:hypothetical protein
MPVAGSQTTFDALGKIPSMTYGTTRIGAARSFDQE